MYATVCLQFHLLLSNTTMFMKSTDMSIQTSTEHVSYQRKKHISIKTFRNM